MTEMAMFRQHPGEQSLQTIENLVAAVGLEPTTYGL